MEQQQNPIMLILTILFSCVMLFYVFRFGAASVAKYGAQSKFIRIVAGAISLFVIFGLVYLYSTLILFALHGPLKGDAAGQGMGAGLFALFVVIPVSIVISIIIWAFFLWLAKVSATSMLLTVGSLGLVHYLLITAGITQALDFKSKRNLNQIRIVKEKIHSLIESDLTNPIEKSEEQKQILKSALQGNKLYVAPLYEEYFREAYQKAYKVTIPYEEASNSREVYVSPLLKSTFFKDTDTITFTSSQTMKVVELTEAKRKSRIPYLALMSWDLLNEGGILAAGLIVRFENTSQPIEYYMTVGMEPQEIPSGYYKFSFPAFYVSKDYAEYNSNFLRALLFNDVTEINESLERYR